MNKQTHRWQCEKCGAWIGEQYDECMMCKFGLPARTRNRPKQHKGSKYKKRILKESNGVRYYQYIY